MALRNRKKGSHGRMMRVGRFGLAGTVQLVAGGTITLMRAKSAAKATKARGPQPPTGTVAFMFTDIEGSTRLARRRPADYEQLLDEHRSILRETFARHAGFEVSTEGDSFFVVFGSPFDALRAAAEGQRALTGKEWPPGADVRVRIGLHLGEATLRGGDYVGLEIHRAARVGSSGHGGQVLISDATVAVIGDRIPDGLGFRDLGEYRLKDFDAAARIHQLTGPGLLTEFGALKAEPVRPTNLPERRSSFIGRRQERMAVVQALRANRLVTLTGPGGSGKTSLAVEAARDCVADYPDGVWLVDLAALREPEFVVTSIGRVLGVAAEPGRPQTEGLAAHLGRRRLVLVLDNLEQLLPEVASLIDHLLDAAAGLRILATSRESLHIAGEQEFPVMPLDVPDATAPPAQLAAADAVRLFVERGRGVDPSFKLSDANLIAVAGIVRRLDGLPLAIELAAARVKLLAPAEILVRLERGSRELGQSSAVRPERQRTLREAIGWSYRLLSHAEQPFFARLSIFAGGCTLDSADEVCNSSGDLAFDSFEVLASLVDKSLVTRLGSATVTRFGMLETIRDYARDKLEALDPRGETAARHLAWCLDLCRRAEPELVGSHQREWFDRITAEHDNVRAAMAWGLEREPRAMLEMAKSLYWFWQARGHISEGRAWLAAGLARPEASAADALRQQGLLAAGTLAWLGGDDHAARPQLSESSEIASQIGDQRARALALAILGQSLVYAGDFAAARTVIEEGVAMARKVGDLFVLARSLAALADLARHEEKDEETVRAADEAVTISERRGMDGAIAFGLYYGSHGLRSRDPDRARAQLLRAIELFDRLDQVNGLYLAIVALLDVARPGPEAAARLLGARDVLRERAGQRESKVELQMSEGVSTAAIGALGPDRFATLVAEGRSMPRPSVLSLARGLA
jgi:predicted ATPase/class 3 adenylate cyclase